MYMYLSVRGAGGTTKALTTALFLSCNRSAISPGGLQQTSLSSTCKT